MKKNRMKGKLRRGEAVFGVSVMIPSPQIVEMIAAAGFDWVLLDCEHGTLTLESVELMAMAAEASGITAIARPVSRAPEHILQVLDRGVMGVQVPHVNTGADARRVLEAVKYHPLGLRSLAAGTRAAVYDSHGTLADYVAAANNETLVASVADRVFSPVGDPPPVGCTVKRRPADLVITRASTGTVFELRFAARLHGPRRDERVAQPEVVHVRAEPHVARPAAEEAEVRERVEDGRRGRDRRGVLTPGRGTTPLPPPHPGGPAPTGRGRRDAGLGKSAGSCEQRQAGVARRGALAQAPRTSCRPLQSTSHCGQDSSALSSPGPLGTMTCYDCRRLVDVPLESPICRRCGGRDLRHAHPQCRRLVHVYSRSELQRLGQLHVQGQ